MLKNQGVHKYSFNNIYGFFVLKNEEIGQKLVITPFSTISYEICKSPVDINDLPNQLQIDQKISVFCSIIKLCKFLFNSIQHIRF
jgi:hypothetical protein